MSHVYKKVKRDEPTPFSFVDAVKRLGDSWGLAAPGLKTGLEDRTQDFRELQNMTLMERGIFSRVDAVAYPSSSDIEVSYDHGHWYAHRGDYDGAPDSHCPLGIDRRSKFAAIADLLEQETP